jgi:hypothetical protein
MQEDETNRAVFVTGRRFKDFCPVAGWALVFLLLAGALQAYIPYPWDGDTAYHAAVGQLIRQHGILYAFPWTPFSWLANHYADKELLFHLLFVPLAGISWITAAKIVGTVAGAAVLMALYLVLRAEGVRFPGLWTLVPLAASCAFVYRFALVRPHLLSIALSLVVLWAATRGRLLILALASAIYPWAYVAWHLPVFLVLVAEGARLLSGERPRWKPTLVAFAGVAVGVALHPNNLNLVRLTWIQIVDVLFRNAWGTKEGFDLGSEFQPFSMDKWARLLLIAVTMAVASLAISWRDRKNGSTPLAFALVSLAFGILTVRTARFTEYFLPFSAAALALSSRSVPWRFLPHAVLGISALYTLSLSSDILVGLANRGNDVPPSVASYMRQQIPPGAQVFTCDWGLTGALMQALPDRRFIVALDPTFFYEKDPDLYRIWYRLPREAPPDSADTIRHRFGARYAICLDKPGRHAFFYRLSSTPGVRTLLVTDIWMLFDLGAPQQ